MANIDDELIQNIIELSNGNVAEQLKACNKLSKIVKNIGAAKSVKLLPILIKFMSSSNCRVQKNAVTFLATILKVRENIQIFIASDAVSKLVELLSTSEDQNILKECLNCLIIISDYFPVEVAKAGAIAPLLNFLKSKIIPQNSLKAASVLKNISKENQNIDAIIRSESIQFFVNLLNSKIIELIKEAIIILANIAAFDENCCQQILNFGILDQLKNNFNNSKLKFVSLQFIYGILYSEEQIDEIIDKCIILSILKVLSNRDGPEVKKIAVNIIQAVVEKKPLYCPTLIDNDILELISDQLDSDNIQLQISSLTTLKSIVETIGCHIINEKLDEQLHELCNNGSDKIKDISTEILTFENNIQLDVAEINVKAEIKTEKVVDEQHFQVHPDEINADEVERSRSNISIELDSNSLMDHTKKAVKEPRGKKKKADADEDVPDPIPGSNFKRFLTEQITPRLLVIKDKNGCVFFRHYPYFEPHVYCKRDECRASYDIDLENGKIDYDPNKYPDKHTSKCYSSLEEAMKTEFIHHWIARIRGSERHVNKHHLQDFKKQLISAFETTFKSRFGNEAYAKLQKKTRQRLKAQVSERKITEKVLNSVQPLDDTLHNLDIAYIIQKLIDHCNSNDALIEIDELVAAATTLAIDDEKKDEEEEKEEEAEIDDDDDGDDSEVDALKL